jgi:MFS family permease
MAHEFRRGWRVLTASFLGVGVSMVSLLYYSTGVFIKPLEQEFGWTRAQIGFSGILSVLTITVFAPLIGRAIDRIGLRKITTVSLVLYALGVFALSQMNGSLIIYYVIVVGYTIVGVGSSPIAFTRAVTAWFVQNRGLALGISLSSTGVAGVLLPMFLTPWVADHGWRSGYQVLGGIVLLAIPIVWYWIRDAPPVTEPSGTTGEAAATGVDVRTAMTDKNFWLLAGIFFLVALAVSGLLVSFIPLLLDMGFTAAQAGSYGALIGAAVMGGRLVTGFTIDRLFAPWVAATIFALVALGCLSFLLGGGQLAFATAIALGFAMGAEVDLLGYFTARYFGMRNYATLYAFLYSGFTIGAGLSPAIAGFIYDTYGDYDFALMGAVGLLTIATIFSLLLSRFPGAELGPGPEERIVSARPTPIASNFH